MSFLPNNERDKFQRQREYKAALDAQVDLKGRVESQPQPALPSIRPMAIQNQNMNPIQAKHRFPQYDERNPGGVNSKIPPRIPPYNIQAPRGRVSEEFQADDLPINGNDRLRVEISSVREAFLQFSQEQDERVDLLASQFKQETDRLLQASRTNIQSVVAINEELEGVVSRQEGVSERLAALSRSDGQVQAKLEETKQMFFKELDDLRSAVLRTAGLKGDSDGDREDRRLLWQLALMNEKAVGETTSALTRHARVESQQMEYLTSLQSQQSETQALLTALTKQVVDRPAADPNRVYAVEKGIEAQAKVLAVSEREVHSLRGKLLEMEARWEQSTADGFRRMQAEARADKEAVYQALQV